jgi:hypothetical protein
MFCGIKMYTRVQFFLFIHYFLHYFSYLVSGSFIKCTSAFGFWRKPNINFVGSFTLVSHISSICSIDLKSSMPRSSFDREELGIQKAVKCKKIYSFQEARRLARGHGFSSKEEFLLYDCPGAYQLPKNPNDIYQEEGWIDWDDFLGIPYASYEDAKLVVQKDILPQNHLLTKEEYLIFMQELSLRKKIREASDEDREARIGRLPYRPDIYYQNSWLGWEDYLDITQETN